MATIRVEHTQTHRKGRGQGKQGERCLKFTQCKAKVIQRHTAMNRKVGAVIKMAKAQCTGLVLAKGGEGGRRRGDNF